MSIETRKPRLLPTFSRIRLRRKLRANEITLIELANALSLSESWLSRALGGLRPLPVDVADRINAEADAIIARRSDSR